MSTKVTTAIEGGVARITMDDGKVNAMSTPMMDEINQALNAAEAAGAIVVLAGRTGIFSAGFDLSTFKRGREATLEMLRAGAGLIQRLLAFPRPVMTVCTGHAYPMGAFLMMSADVRFGLDGAWRIGMNEVAIGLTVPKFAIELARHRLTPPGFAAISSAAMFAPTDAMRLGYLDQVLPSTLLASAIEEEVTRLCALDMPSFAATKARINEHALQAIGAALDREIPIT